MKAGKVYYEVVDSSLHGITKGQLYSMSKLWLFNQFHDVNSYLQIDDPDNGLIAGRMTLGSIGFTLKGSYTCSFSFLIISKDGRYKAQLYDFILTGETTSYCDGLEHFIGMPETYKDFRNALPTLEARANGFIKSIQYTMQSVYDVMDF